MALSEEGFGLAFELLELGRIIFSDKYLKLAFKPRDELDRNDLILLDKDLLDDLDDEEFDEDLVKIEDLLVKEEEVLETFLGSSSSGNSWLYFVLSFLSKKFPFFLNWIFLACQ